MSPLDIFIILSENYILFNELKEKLKQKLQNSEDDVVKRRNFSILVFPVEV